MWYTTISISAPDPTRNTSVACSGAQLTHPFFICLDVALMDEAKVRLEDGLSKENKRRAL
jgi:hypothetical protein